MAEKHAETIYARVLDLVRGLVGVNTTFTQELEAVGDALIPGFQGVHAADEQPDLAPGESSISNLDKRGMPGSHWVALFGLPGDEVAVYDSFGRPTEEILPDFEGTPRDAEYDAEQPVTSLDCGARSLAWLILAKRWGVETALLV